MASGRWLLGSVKRGRRLKHGKKWKEYAEVNVKAQKFIQT